MTGDRWFPDLPVDWKSERVKHLVRYIDKKVPAADSEMQFIGLEQIESWTGRRIASEDASAEGIGNSYEPGDVIFGKLRPYLAKVYMTESAGVCSSEFLVLRSSLIPSRYLTYVLLSRPFIDAVNAWTYGVKMPRASWDVIGSLLMPVPPRNSITPIVKFLDIETAKADALVAKYEKLIELLEEKRVVLITQAVTKGLDPNVPMKDSGIEWIGEIPVHWTVKPLARAVRAIKTGPFGSVLHSEDYVDDGIPVINPAHIISGKLVPDRRITVSSATRDRLIQYALSAGDIVLGRRGEMGRAGIVGPDEQGWLCGTGCMKLVVNTQAAVPEFLALSISSNRAKQWLSLQSLGSTMDNLNPSIVGRYPLVLPSIAEQEQILENLREANDELDALRRKAQKAIDLVKEHKSALITAAVTGQIDVRTYQSKDIEVSA